MIKKNRIGGFISLCCSLYTCPVTFTNRSVDYWMITITDWIDPAEQCSIFYSLTPGQMIQDDNVKACSVKHLKTNINYSYRDLNKASSLIFEHPRSCIIS